MKLNRNIQTMIKVLCYHESFSLVEIVEKHYFWIVYYDIISMKVCPQYWLVHSRNLWLMSMIYFNTTNLSLFRNTEMMSKWLQINAIASIQKHV